MMAVFQRLELSLLERLLGAVAQEAALQLVAFVNQPAGAGTSIPDARISSNFDFWFEVKTVPNALSVRQLNEHYKNLTDGAMHERLFIVTPDVEKPLALETLDDDRVIWFNFRGLSDAIDEVLGDTTMFVGERTRFLLSELKQLFIVDGLVDFADTVIVAARIAWGEFNDHGVYICQPDRSFRRGLTHMGFYVHGAIQPTVAKILDQRSESIVFDHATVEKMRSGGPIEIRISHAIEAALAKGTRREGQSFRVFVLSRNVEEGSVALDSPILNSTKTASGRTWAWTMAQRYTRLAALTKPGLVTTSDLELAGG